LSELFSAESKIDARFFKGEAGGEMRVERQEVILSATRDSPLAPQNPSNTQEHFLTVFAFTKILFY
jgi:hypothetical protein